MKFSALALAAAVAISIPVAASAAEANCARDYKAFWDSLNNGPAKGLTGDQLALVGRQALRGYDACSAGDEASAKSIFDKIREAAPAKGEDFWKQLAQTAPAKK
jgi:hypothetical protein